ncbi:hypothetical protein [Nocardia sp. NPDC051570]|uniref:hypothetical protein n=1 Tax=Nocardia sp. NPDC051570 TaxID=3364324 RepID=UPI0037989596
MMTDTGTVAIAVDRRITVEGRPPYQEAVPALRALLHLGEFLAEGARVRADRDPDTADIRIEVTGTTEDGLAFRARYRIDAAAAMATELADPATGPLR